MDSITNNTAILYFTLSADEEARTKRLSGTNSFSANQSVARELIDKTFTEINEAGLPVVRFSSDVQVGDSFGERITHAFEVLFAEGFENVIAVGNDCPQLSSLHIQKACRGLSKHAFVIGPATDGGAYLIGAKRDVFDHESFRNLRWKTDALLSDLVLSVTRSGHPVKLLEELSDIDNRQDLLSRIRDFEWSPQISLKLFSAFLLRITASVKKKLLPCTWQHSLLLFFVTASPHRGPPSGNPIYS